MLCYAHRLFRMRMYQIYFQTKRVHFTACGVSFFRWEWKKKTREQFWNAIVHDDMVIFRLVSHESHKYDVYDYDWFLLFLLGKKKTTKSAAIAMFSFTSTFDYNEQWWVIIIVLGVCLMICIQIHICTGTKMKHTHTQNKIINREILTSWHQMCNTFDEFRLATNYNNNNNKTHRIHRANLIESYASASSYLLRVQCICNKVKVICAR